jgi:putative RecB family exonuclease
MIATTSAHRPPGRVSLPVAPATEQVLPDHLSWSQVYTMRSCPQKFLYTYIEHPPKDFIASSLKFGSAVHAGLEHFFRERMEGMAADRDALMHVYSTTWAHDEEPDVPIRFNKNEDASTLAATAQGMFTAFLASPLATVQSDILAVEEQFRSVLVPDLPDVICRVDLIYAAEGAIHLVDFKTSRSRWNPTKVAEAADQLRLYEILTSSVSGDTPVVAEFAVLTKAKTPAFDLHTVTPAESDQTVLQQVTDTFRQVYKAMQDGNYYPVPSPQNCTTCPFKSKCPAYVGSA